MKKILLCLFFLNACAIAPVSYTSTPPLEIIKDEWCTVKIGAGNLRNVCGTVVNNTGRYWNNITINVNLYDKENNQIGNTMAYAQNLEPHGKWKFKAPVQPFVHDGATSYKIYIENYY